MAAFISRLIHAVLSVRCAMCGTETTHFEEVGKIKLCKRCAHDHLE